VQLNLEQNTQRVLNITTIKFQNSSEKYGLQKKACKKFAGGGFI